MSILRSRLYVIFVCLYSLLGVGFDILVAGSLYGIQPINVFERSLKGATEASSILLLFGPFALMTVLCVLIYIASLDPFRAERPWGLVYLNFLPISLFVGSIFIPLNFEERDIANPLQGTVILFVSFGVPALILALEVALSSLLLFLGRFFDDRGWRAPAFFFLKNSLRWRPAVHETARRCGLLLVEMSRFKRARGLLERLGPIDTTEDLEVLRALEHVYASEGESPLALKALQRQRQLQPSVRSLDQRILQQSLALDQFQDAIALLESGRIEPDLDKIALLEQLYVKTGDFPKAILTARRMAEKESVPYSRSIRLLSDLVDGFPENTELMIELALLMQKTNNTEQMEQGAKLLERALKREPGRTDLRRLLANYYQQTLQYEFAGRHYQQLILDGDEAPETYLNYAEVLKAESHPDEARVVYHRMRDACPEDWRGYFREAEMLFTEGRLDDTENLLDQAQAFVPESGAMNVHALRKRISQRREENQLRMISEDISSAAEEDVEKRLQYIRQLISLERNEQAVGECDQLIQDHPELREEIERIVRQGIESLVHNYRLRDYLADLYFREERYDEALEMFRGMAEQSLHPDKVIEAGCRKILARNPDHLEARLALAEVYRRQRNWEQVLATYKPLMLDHVPAEAARRVRTNWIEAAHEAGQVEEAMELALRVFEEYKDDPAFVIMVIRVLEDSGEYEKAYEVFKVGQAAFPENEELQNMSRTVADNKKRNRMQELQILEGQNRLTPAEHYEKAELHRQFGQVHHAITHYQRAADEPELRDLALTKMGICLCDRRLFDLANETLDQIELTKEKVSRLPELKDMLYWVADVLEQQQYKNEALKYFKRIFRVDAAYKDVVTRLEKLDSG